MMRYVRWASQARTSMIKYTIKFTPIDKATKKSLLPAGLTLTLTTELRAPSRRGAIKECMRKAGRMVNRDVKDFTIKVRSAFETDLSKRGTMTQFM
jgi:hypothetical protein